MDNKIVLVGGGGHCKSVIDTICTSLFFSEIAITDKNLPKDMTILGYKIYGKDDCLEELFFKGFKQAFITIGSIDSSDGRVKLYEKLKDIGFIFPKIIDATAIVAKTAKIGNGVFVGKRASINAESIIDAFSIINSGAIIEHECKVGSFSHVSVGAVVCGQVEIEDSVFIGANATIIQGLHIGKRSVIGAGAVVTTDLPPNSMAVGIPAKIIKKLI